MTCEAVKQWMTESRPFSTESGDSLPVSVAEHLGSCAACQHIAQWEAFVHRNIHQVEVPANLEADIHYALRQARRARQRARTLYVSMAAAAALLLAVCAGWYLQRPYDLARLSEAVVAVEGRRTIASLTLSQPPQAQELKRWLERQGVNVTIPGRLKLQYLTAVHLIEVGGRKVPVLELRAGGITSNVCLLERRYFNEKSQRELHDQGNLTSFIVADSDDSTSLGWMIVDQSSAHLFVEGCLNPNGA